MNQLVPIDNGHEYRVSTDAAGLCGAIVQQTAKDIQGRRFVSVEGWQAIAIAHGCAASAKGVERVDGGVRAIGEVRRMSDGQLIATGEGFVGEDEPVWFGGPMRKWKWGQKRGEKVWYEEDMPKRPDYAIRAMAQTRAISRACRSAFAHVVVMIDAGLSTTPAEEVPDGGFVEGQFEEVTQRQVSPSEPANLRQQLEQSIEQETWKPRDNWGGRYPNKTALKKAMHAHHAELERLGIEGTFDDLEDLLTSPEYKDFVAIAADHAPYYLDGERHPDAPPEFIQTFTLEQKARDLIALRGNVAADPVEAA